MRILSFDVGIKYGILFIEIDTSNVSIIDWSIINLMDETTSHICTISQKNGKICKSKAKFMLNNNYYCEKHAKSSNLLIHSSDPTSQLNKLKMNYFNYLMRFINIDKNQNKELLLKKLMNIWTNALQKLQITKKSASEMDLISIGKNMKTKMDISIFKM